MNGLPVSLTETGPYKDVLSYFSSILGIEVIRPEDLRSYFNDNHSFLEDRDNDWLVRLYKLYETVPNIFSESNYRNILDAVIVPHSIQPYGCSIPKIAVFLLAQCISSVEEGDAGRGGICPSISI